MLRSCTRQQSITMNSRERQEQQTLEALLHRQIAYMIAEGFAKVSMNKDGTTTLVTTTPADIEAEVARIAAL